MGDLIDFIGKFTQKKIMVVGDFVADEFIIGQPERLSREAPVIILRKQEQEILPGGGANAAHNIATLGGMVELVGVVGDDPAGQQLKKYMSDRGMNVSGLITSKNKPTAVKTRVLAGGEQVVKQQVVRIDQLDNAPISKELEDELLAYISTHIPSCDGVLLSDYGLGVFTPRLRRELIRLAREHEKIVAVDSRYNLLDFKGATIATPNLEEASKVYGKKLKKQEEIVRAGHRLLMDMDLDYLLITQGGDGMTIFTRDKSFQHIPAANYTEVYDVTGAGDTVVGTMILALTSGADIYQSMEMANHAAGIVVRKSGVATVSPSELAREVV